MLAGLIQRFVYLIVGLLIVLVFVGAKFIVSHLFGKVPIWDSLPFIVTVVTISIVSSLYKTRGQARKPVPSGSPTGNDDLEDTAGSDL